MTPEPRIIVAETHGHWNAWFEDRPQETFGGDTPGTAVERLWEAELNNRAARKSVALRPRRRVDL
jgi:hypothetical protein